MEEEAPPNTMHAHLKLQPEWPARIAQLLRKHRLTQAALAERLGVSSATVSRWMKGTHEPTEKRTSLWAISLDLPKMLIFGSEQALIQAVFLESVPGFWPRRLK